MRVKPTGWHFYILSKREGMVWLVTVVAQAGKPGEVVAIEGTYNADDSGEWHFNTTQHLFNLRQRQVCSKGLLTRANVNATLDILQDRMDNALSLAGEEWQRM